MGKKMIYYFDTEQSHFDVFRVVKRVLKDSSVEAKANFEAYGLRTLPPKDRLFLIEQKIYYTDSLGIVVIDGVRDLVSDINSPEEATFVSSKLLKWSQEIHIHIIVVLHQNKGDNNARGHLGTEIVNKAESVISVEKDNEVSLVKPVFLRGKDFEPFGFSIDAAGMPYFLEDYSDNKGKQKGKINCLRYSRRNTFQSII